MVGLTGGVNAHSASGWTLVGRETLSGLPATVYVGLAVSSHVDGSLATAKFDNLAVASHVFTRPPTAARLAWPAARPSTVFV